MFSTSCEKPASIETTGVKEEISSHNFDDLPKLNQIPEKADASCNNRRAKIYDECSNQYDLYLRARKLADSEGKSLLITYGAEWCIWCHVFEKYIHGEYKKFDYVFGDEDNPTSEKATLREKSKYDPAPEAYELSMYVRKTFVVLNLDYANSTGADRVMFETGAHEYFDNWLPFIFTVDGDGRYVDNLSNYEVMIRRDKTFDWYRGYDRKKLQSALNEMHQKSISD